MSVSVTDVTSTEYLVMDRNRVSLLTPFGETERGLAFAEAAAINKFRTKQFGWDPEADKVHVEVRITHTRVEQYEVKE